MVYKQMVLLFLDYLDILIDGCAKKFVDRLQTLQFRGIKIIYQYNFEGDKITFKDETRLHLELGLLYVEKYCLPCDSYISTSHINLLLVVAEL